MKLKIEYIDINKLKAYKKNAKIHTEEQIEQIKKSIQEFGMNDPIAVWKDNEIIEGHGRLLACQELGEKKVPIIKLDNLTDEQRRAYMLVHNQLTMNTGFDLDILQQELDGITSIDMDEFGFNYDIETTRLEVEEDDYEVELPPKPKSKLGEIYKLGEHTLMCGDSTSEIDVDRLMQGAAADLVVTDPPYNVNYGDKAEMLNEYLGGNRHTDSIENDAMGSEQFTDFLDSAFKNMAEHLKEGGAFYVWHASITVREFMEALERNNLTSRQQIIWVKNALVLGRQDYQRRHEPCLYGWKDGAGHYFINDRTLTTVIEQEIDLEAMKKEDMKKLLEQILNDTKQTIIYENKPMRNAEHPTMKPVKLIGKMIENSSKPGETVLDLFGGSGSTLIAAEQLKRRCYMMEYDPKYVDVIIDRWEEFTGKKAEKLK